MFVQIYSKSNYIVHYKKLDIVSFLNLTKFEEICVNLNTLVKFYFLN